MRAITVDKAKVLLYNKVMDSSDKPRSRIPIAVKISSDAEPVECDGYYVARGDGFSLMFGTPSCAYEIDHDGQNTKLKADGILSYVLNFTDGGVTTVKASFGGLDITLTPIRREVSVCDAGVKLALAYILSGASGETERAVEVDARFLIR